MVRVVRLIQMNLTIALHRPANVRPTELKLWAHAARDSIKPRDLRGVDKFNTFTSVSWANLTLHLVGLNKRNSVVPFGNCALQRHSKYACVDSTS